MRTIMILVLGILFGTVLITSGAFSWSVINDMFHFRSFHMFGLLGSAVVTGAFGVFLIRRYRLNTVYGNPIVIKPKMFEWKNNLSGGLIFGLGWGLTGTCSAPVFIVLGLNWRIGILLVVGAVSGVILFAFYRKLTGKIN